MNGRAPATLIYDGDCAFCESAARWIESKWPDDDLARAKIVPSRALTDDDRDRMGLSTDDLQRAAWWVEGDKRRGGHLAVAHALVVAGGGWGLAGRALLLPPIRWLAAPGYRLVARYRHRLPGATADCRT